MVNSELNNQLKDVKLAPLEISQWPGLGWWIIACLLLLTISILIIKFVQERRKNAYRLEALSVLNTLQSQTNPDMTPQAINTVLKRTALSAYPSIDINALYGKAWFDFLNRQVKKPVFNSQLIESMVYGQYAANTPIDLDAFYKSSCSWIKLHEQTLQPNISNHD